MQRASIYWSLSSVLLRDIGGFRMYWAHPHRAWAKLWIAGVSFFVYWGCRVGSNPRNLGDAQRRRARSNRQFIQLRDVTPNSIHTHTFSQSLSVHKSTINPKLVVLTHHMHDPGFIAGECSCSWPSTLNENLKEDMSSLRTQVTRSTSRGTEYEMVCCEEPDGLRQDSSVHVALWI